MTKKTDIVGKKFGKLLVLREHKHRNECNKPRFVCRCDCGNSHIVQGNNLKSGQVKTCGCKRRKHGMYGQKEYRAWRSMKKRCYQLTHDSYPYYGGRGIRVCRRWLNSFENFYNDVGPAPSPQHSIDRKRVNGNYTPSNVRWATKSEQVNNRRSWR